MNDAKNPVIQGSALDALADGLKAGGFSFACSYPGFYAHDLADRLGIRLISVNEKTAYAMAWGAAAAGSRSVVCFKNVGLNDAADPYLNSQLLSITAGLVMVVFDDIDGETCQIVQDSRHYQAIHGGFWYEPSSVEDAWHAGRHAFEWSERIGAPVTLRMTNLLCKREGAYCRSMEASIEVPAFSRKQEEMVVHPANLNTQRERKLKRDAEILCLAEELMPPPPREPGQQKDLYFGSALASAEEGCQSAWTCRTLPLPPSLAKSLAGSTPIHVHEHGDPVAAGSLAKMLASPPVTSSRPSSINPNRRYHDRVWFEPLFSQLRAIPHRVVCSDLGEFTMDPHRTVDLCLCYGMSVATAAGIAATTHRPVFAVSGDGAFVHGGKSSLEEACARSLRFRVIVFDNGGCQGTGGQAVPATLHCRFEGLDTMVIDWSETGNTALTRAIKTKPCPERMELWIIRLPGQPQN